MTYKNILLRCPECGREQEVEPRFYEFALCGHPLTCNGGNPGVATHHDHTVIMRPEVLEGSTRLSCPRCGYPMYCGCCKTCRAKIPDGYKAQIVSEDGEGYICANCGLEMGVDPWGEEEELQILRRIETNDADNSL